MQRPLSRSIGAVVAVVVCLGIVGPSCSSDSDDGGSAPKSSNAKTMDVKELEHYLNGENSSDPNPVVTAKCPNAKGKVALGSTIICEVTLKDGSKAKRKVQVDPSGAVAIFAA